MSNKEIFIKTVSEMFDNMDANDIPEEAMEYFKTLCEKKPKEKFTENGKMILVYMRDNKENTDNKFKAKDIGDGMGVSSRTVAGAMRKLVLDGYVAKVGENPTVYAITDTGIEFDCE